MSKKILVLTILLVLVLGFSAVSPAEARGFGWKGFWGFPNFNLDDWTQRMEKMFENWANLLQISLEKIKNYWAEGKTMKEIMEAENISQEEVQKRMKEMRLEGLKNQLQKLVEKGIITQEQADKRLKFYQSQLEKLEGKGFGKFWPKGYWFWKW